MPDCRANRVSRADWFPYRGHPHRSCRRIISRRVADDGVRTQASSGGAYGAKNTSGNSIVQCRKRRRPRCAAPVEARLLRERPRQAGRRRPLGQVGELGRSCCRSVALSQNQRRRTTDRRQWRKRRQLTRAPAFQRASALPRGRPPPPSRRARTPGSRIGTACFIAEAPLPSNNGKAAPAIGRGPLRLAAAAASPSPTRPSGRRRQRTGGIEERQGSAARQRGQPHRKQRHLHRHRIGIDAVEAVLRDEPAVQSARSWCR